MKHTGIFHKTIFFNDSYVILNINDNKMFFTMQKLISFNRYFGFARFMLWQIIVHYQFGGIPLISISLSKPDKTVIRKLLSAQIPDGSHPVKLLNETKLTKNYRSLKNEWHSINWFGGLHRWLLWCIWWLLQFWRWLLQLWRWIVRRLHVLLFGIFPRYLLLLLCVSLRYFFCVIAECIFFYSIFSCNSWCTTVILLVLTVVTIAVVLLLNYMWKV